MASNEAYPDSHKTNPQEKCTKVGPYLLMETIGIGTTSKVKVAVNQGSYERFACKVMDKRNIRANTSSPQVQKEIFAMRQLSHKNVVSFQNVLTTTSKIYIIMELVEGVELFQEIRQHTRLSEPYARLFFTQLIEGIQHCHERGVYHRDLKPENLMITKDKVLKITDFGLSNLKGHCGTGSMSSVSGSLLLKTQCGTPNYVAPEIITLDNETTPDRYSGSKVDIWACGVILFILVAGYLPFDSPQTDVLFKSILRGRIAYPEWFSPELVDLISNMLKIETKDRYTLPKIRRHDWFNDLIQYSNYPDSDCELSPTLPPNISDTIPRPQEESNPPGSISYDPVNHHTQAPHTHRYTPTGEESRLAKYSVQQQHLEHAEPGRCAQELRAGDSLDFGLRVATAEGELDVSCLDGFMGPEAELVPHTETSEKDVLLGDVAAPSIGKGLGAPPGLESVRAIPGNHVDRVDGQQKLDSSSSSIGSTGWEEQESESEEAEEVHDPSTIHVRRVRLSSTDNGSQGAASIRRACSLEDMTGVSHHESDDQAAEAVNGEGRGTMEHLSVRGRVNRQLWDCAAEFQLRGLDEDTGRLVAGYQSGDLEAIRKSLSMSMDLNVTKAQGSPACTGVPHRKLMRSKSHDGVVSLQTRRKPRFKGNKGPNLQEGWVASAPSGKVRWNGSGKAPMTDTSVMQSWSSTSHKKHRKTANQRRRRGSVRFQEADSNVARVPRFEDDTEWVGSEEKKIIWCRMMKDFDMVPDEKEFNMDSSELNEIWTTGLAQEDLAQDSFSAKRFVTPSFSPSRSTRYLSGASMQSAARSTTPVVEERASQSGNTHSNSRSVKVPHQRKGLTKSAGEAATLDGGFGMSRVAPILHTRTTGITPGVGLPHGRNNLGVPNEESWNAPKREERPVLSAMPSHMIKEMMPPSRSVSPGRFSPNGRTPVGTHELGDSFVSSEQPSFRRLNGSPLSDVPRYVHGNQPDPADASDCVKLGQGGDFPAIPGTATRDVWAREAEKGDEATSGAIPSGAESFLTGSGGVSDQHVGSSDSADVSSARGSSAAGLMRSSENHANHHAGSVPTTSSSERTTALDDVNFPAESQTHAPVNPYTPTMVNGAATAPVRPFEIDIPGPPMNAAPPSTKRSLVSLLPIIDSAKRWLVGKPGSPLDTKSFTQFQSHLSPEGSYIIIKELLVDNGCAVVKGRPSRSGERFTIRCEYKRAKENVAVFAKITISKFDEVLSSILFERKGRTKEKQFLKFYSSLYELYCETAYKDE